MQIVVQKCGSKVEMMIEKGKVLVHSQKKSLDDMLAGVNEKNIHLEVSTGCAVGKEEW